tara:strand:- start:367 stop:471 length:105 start_codon:yes stop_codon:yes gene_type:complete
MGGGEGRAVSCSVSSRCHGGMGGCGRGGGARGAG